MKNILIPTDFSDNAYNALLYATHLFKKEPCQFYLLHSFENEVTMSTSRVDIGKTEKVLDRLFKETYEKLTSLSHSIVLDSEGLGHRFETVASSKELFREINFMIVGMAIDYVVMGTQGATAAKGIFLGSTSVKIVKKIKDCPLLLIPEEIDFKPVGEIAFTSGFKRPFSDFQIQSIMTLAKINNAQVQIVHIREQEKLTDQQKENLFQLKNKLATVAPEVCWIDKETSITSAILDFVVRRKVDLLAMIYYKHGFINSLFHESVIKKISLQPETPFLMIPSSS